MGQWHHVHARRQIGNFPQAFSHLVFISSAKLLDAVRPRGTHHEAAVPIH